MTPLKPYLIRSLHEWILDNGLTPYFLVDSTIENISVPRAYITDGKIILNTHPDAIENWSLDHEQISFTARFSGKVESIYIPIHAVLAVYAKENGKGMMFDEQHDDDMPPEPPEDPKPITKKAPILKVVK